MLDAITLGAGLTLAHHSLWSKDFAAGRRHQAAYQIETTISAIVVLHRSSRTLSPQMQKFHGAEKKVNVTPREKFLLCL
jgi:hypothetical protein